MNILLVNLIFMLGMPDFLDFFPDPDKRQSLKGGDSQHGEGCGGGNSLLEPTNLPPLPPQGRGKARGEDVKLG